jgi:hypothetical protein
VFKEKAKNRRSYLTALQIRCSPGILVWIQLDSSASPQNDIRSSPGIFAGDYFVIASPEKRGEAICLFIQKYPFSFAITKRRSGMTALQEKQEKTLPLINYPA